MSEYSLIGKRLPRVDALAKATGSAQYTDDMVLPGMLHGRMLRSPHPHARIVRIDASRARALPGVAAVITGDDLSAVRYGNWRLFPATQDEMALARDKVRYVGDEVAAVAAVDVDTAEEALTLISVEYEILPAVFDYDAALAPDAPILHEETPGNISVERTISFGELDDAFTKADYVREDVFRLQAVSPAYLEPCSALAQADAQGRITLISTTQTPYIVQCLLAKALGVRENEVRVIKPALGGGFGGKMELRAWDVCAARIAQLTGRPVKFTLDREEELAVGRRRHAVRLHSRVAFRKDGMLLGKEVTAHLNGGGYNSMGPTATFLIGNFGAMRGLGAPQALFATETQMNLAAQELGIDPIELRIRNAMQPGDTIPEVATMGTCAFRECLEEVARMSDWKARRSEKRKGYGIGVGCYSFISGGVFNWFNTQYAFSAAEVRAYADGTVHLFTMASDIGQGSDSVLVQILAEELGLRIEDVQITSADTAMTPKADLGTWGSRVTLMAGNAVLEAAHHIKRELFQMISLRFDSNVIHEMECREGMVRVKGQPKRSIPFAEAVAMWQKAHRGEPLIGRGSYTPRDMGLVSPAFSFGAQVVELHVDEDTGQIKVDKVHTAHDCGRMLNPMSVEGQVEGCIQMGLGYALMEELVTREGKTLNANFLDYKMPGALDMPEAVHSTIEIDDPRGPFGAKEAGEGPVSPTAPAIADALWHATGVRVADLPITPEKVLVGLDALAGRETATSAAPIEEPFCARAPEPIEEPYCARDGNP
jgi:4-hydroxybenzoyl-CoA reductase subunit alpha